MTRSQQLLSHANSRIASRSDKGALTKEYRTVVLGAAAMIQNAGLAQALAYFQAKAAKEPAYAQLIEDLESSPIIRQGLLDRACKAHAGEYMRLTRLVTQQLLYLKRMTISYFPNDAKEQDHA